MVTDASGNLFVSDAENIAIFEVSAVNGVIPPSPTIRTLYRPTANPEGIAVDAQGNVYFTTLDVNTNLGNNTVTELVAINGSVPSSPQVRQLGSGLFYPDDVAVDQYGNVFVSDSGHGVIKEFLAVNGSVPSSPTILTISTGFGPRGLELDSVGDIYVADATNNQVKEILAVNGSIPPSPTVLTLGSGFCSTGDIALDSKGDVFVTDYCNAAIFELPAVGGTVQPGTAQVKAAGGLNGVEGVAVSPNGTIYGGIVSTTIPAFLPYTGAFGAVDVGSTGSIPPLQVVFDSGGTLGSVSTLTAGATSMDFANASSSTCRANTTYATGQTCTINLTFTPKFAGLRNGAVQLNDANGNVMATSYLHGTGVGPQLIFSPGAQTTLGNTFSFASGVAVDGNGNAFVVDKVNNIGSVQEIMAVNGRIPANPTIKTLVSNLDCPNGPALDAAGNIFFTDVCYHTVNEIQAVNGAIPSSPTVKTVTSQLALPVGIAVDNQGDLFVLDSSNNSVNEIAAVNGVIPASPTITIVASGFKELDGIAVDNSGNVYVSDDSSRAVFEVHAVNGSIPASPLITSLGSGFVIPRGISVDTDGDVYVAEYFYNTVFKLLAVNGSIPSSPVIQTLGAGLTYANGVTLDASGNLYVADYGDARVVSFDFSDPPSLSFTSTSVGSISSDSPQAITVQNIGTASLNFPIPASGNNPGISANFTLDENAPSACPISGNGSSTAGILAAGSSCVLSISFAPTSAGSLSGSLVLTDDNLNAAAPAYATQVVSLSGSATAGASTITWPTPAPITYGTALSSAQLNATANVPGTFAYSPAVGTVLGVGTQQLTVVFTPTDSADYSPANASVQLTVNKAAPVITWPTPAAITYGTALSAAQLDATANVPGTFSYSPAAGSVLAAGTATLHVTFTPSDSTDYTTATSSALLTVNKAMPVITWPSPAPIASGTPLSSMQLNATANVPGTFAYSPAAGSILPVGSNTLNVTFTPTNTANYTTAGASVTLLVNAPNFTLSVSPSSLAVKQGGKASSGIAIASTGGFANSVTLSVTGLPKGVTAAFSANPTNTGSTITFTATNGATLGTSVVTITGKSGTLTHTASITLTVAHK